jgi:hypothetical protein
MKTGKGFSSIEIGNGENSIMKQLDSEIIEKSK